MKFLVIYGTTEGQTRKVAEFVKASLETEGHAVELYDSRRRLLDLDLTAFDGVVMAASVHQKKHQETITNFAIAHKAQLQKMPSLFLSISLAIAFDDSKAEAQRYVDKFVDYTKFEPQKIVLVGGALRFAEYDFFMGQIVEFVVLRKHPEITGDHEFTDWDALGADISDFARSVEGSGG